jgi:CDP-diacylglycerol--glycerol-3-phosphate 3-phosphatidyltransferase
VAREVSRGPLATMATTAVRTLAVNRRPPWAVNRTWTAERTDMLKRARVPLQRVLGPLGHALARRGVSPNLVTAVGAVGVCASALICYPRGWLFWGSFAITIFVLTDLVDGALARARGITGPWGAFLDSCLDRVADSAVFAGLIWWFIRDGQPVLVGLSIFCLAAGNLVSYTRARAEGLGLRAHVGIAERTERTIVVLVATGLSGLGVPFIQAIGLWVLAVGSAITVVQRFAVVYQQASAVGIAPAGSQVAPSDKT